MYCFDGPWRRLLARVIALAPCLLMAAPSVAATQSTAIAPAAAEDLVRRINTELSSAFAARRDEIREDPSRAYQLVDEIAARHTDFPRIARLALGKQWRRASEEQRLRFVEEFRGMLLRTYATALTEHAGAPVTYHQSRVSSNGRTVLVRTQVPSGPDASLRVDYRVGLREGQWMVYDVVVEGVSMVATYRSHFASTARRGGIDAVIEHLAESNRDSGRI